MKFSKRNNRLIALVVLVLMASSLQAQPRRRPGFRKVTKRIVPVSYLGVKIGQDFKNEVTLAGVHLWVPVGRFWRFAPGFDCFLKDENNHWQFNGDFIFQPARRSPLFMGGGLAMDYLNPENEKSQTKLGGNVLVGLVFGRLRSLPFQPFIQARWCIFEEETAFDAQAGFNLALR